MSSNGDLDELNAPPSRQSRRPSNESGKYGLTTTNTQTPPKLTITPQKHSGDSGVESRYSSNSPDAYQQQQQRASVLSNRVRPTAPNMKVESPLAHETPTKERTNAGNVFMYTYFFLFFVFSSTKVNFINDVQIIILKHQLNKK